MSGINLPNKGEVIIDDINTKSKKLSKELRKKVGLVFQNPENQLVFSNIEDDMKFMLENFEFSKKEIDERIDKALNVVGMLDYRNKDTYALSMGQKQRIAIAEMLALNPKYLVLDEPTDADRIIALNEGKIIFECTPKTILQNVNNFKQIGLEIPQMVELVEKLNKNGLNIDTDRFDMDLIIEQIIRGAKC